jgi:hypothetical protein
MYNNQEALTPWLKLGACAPIFGHKPEWVSELGRAEAAWRLTMMQWPELFEALRSVGI